MDFFVVGRLLLVAMARSDLVLDQIHPVIAYSGPDPVRWAIVTIGCLDGENVRVHVTQMEAPGPVGSGPAREDHATHAGMAAVMKIQRKAHDLAAHGPASGVHHAPSHVEPALEHDDERVSAGLIVAQQRRRKLAAPPLLVVPRQTPLLVGVRLQTGTGLVVHVEDLAAYPARKARFVHEEVELAVARTSVRAVCAKVLVHMELAEAGGEAAIAVTRELPARLLIDPVLVVLEVRRVALQPTKLTATPRTGWPASLNTRQGSSR